MKIALIGYGKMGRMIEEIAQSRGHEIVCRIDVDNQQDFSSEAFRNADVAIEFTAPAVAFGNIERAFEAGVKVVSGSTGWYAAHEAEVRRQCTEEGKTLFWSSNFSVGVYVFGLVNRYLARLMNSFPEYSARMEEVHHVHKLDHPSGTAITLAQQIIDETERITDFEALEPVTDTCCGPDGNGGTDASAAAQHAEAGSAGSVLPIQSIRRGEVPGIHAITWDSLADSITITHDAHSRRGFALGAVLAAEYAACHKGLLTMDDLFAQYV